MTRETHTHSDTHEQFACSNVEIQLLVGKHGASNERDYASSRKRIEDLGLKFFKRGFTNILFLEDGLGNLNKRIKSINDTAKRHRSFRFAYWNVVRNFDETDSRDLTQLFDQNPVERFVRVGRTDGLDDASSYITAFMYSQYVALDNIGRKGLKVELAAEKRSNARTKFKTKLDGGELENIKWWREITQLADQVDIEIARQISQLASDHPTRARIMGIMGTAHANVHDKLPLELRNDSKVVEMNPGAQVPGFIVLLRDLQTGALTDQELQRRLDNLESCF